jgi:Salmonella virulence plasmid 65kDa B protein/FG-GAP-like repeat
MHAAAVFARALSGIGMLAFLVNAQAQAPIPGSFAVSPNGAATYTVPIQVPPGVAGMEPKLTLAMNSRSGNGLLGVGWTLSGLPTISRCPRTTPQDGVKGGVQYDSNDRFCLDGRRLILVAGTEGANGAEYRTEIDSLSMVTVVGVADGGGPASFLVKSTSGVTLEFGKTTDSAVEVASRTPKVVRLWAVNKVSDAYGNTQVISYVKPNPGEFYPDRINYTSNPRTGQAATNAVVFAYGSRTDTMVGYQGGSVFQRTKRLTGITTMTGGAAVATYTPTYEYGEGGRSRIKSISLCAPNGLCAATTSFSFKGSGVSGFDDVVSVSSNDGLGANNLWQVMDLNGDGRTDLVRFSGDRGSYAVYLSNGDGSFSISQRFTAVDQYFSSGGWQVIDVDGDANADLVHFNSDGGYTVWRSRGDGTFEVTDKQQSSGDQALTMGHWHVIDVNGDGLADFIHMSSGGAWIWTSRGDGTFSVTNFTHQQDPSGSGYWDVMDLNGDGLADLMHRLPGSERYRWISRGDGTFAVSLVPTDGADPYNTAVFWQQLDLNDDGLVDLLHFGCTGHSACMWLSAGDGTFVTTTMDAAFDSGIGRSLVLDANGDGLSDLVITPANLNEPYYIWESDGLGSFRATALSQSTDTCSSNCTTMRSGDFQGNGMPGFVRLDEKGVRSVWLLGSGSRNIPSAVLNGTGGRTGWTLSTLPQLLSSSRYFKDVPNDNSAFTMASAMAVVSSVEFNAGWAHDASDIDQDRTVTYAYGSARVERNGRGFVGFNWMQSRDSQTGIVTRDYFSQTFPYTGMVVQSGRGTGKGSIASASYWSNLGTVTNTPQCIRPHPDALSGCTVAPGRHYLPYMAQTTERRADLDGTPLPGSRVSRTSLDTFGNVGSLSITALNPDGSDSEYKKVTTNTYFNDADTWVLGRLVKSVVTSSGPDVLAPVVPGSGGLADAAAPTRPKKLPAAILSAVMTTISTLLLDD